MRVDQGSTLLEGVLNINKPAGWTSHDVVAKLRGLFGIRRIGHAGTLDPAATGVLPVLVGRATRIAEYLMDWEKEYLATLRLGETTDTQDATGVIVERRSTDGLTPEAIRAAVSTFQGALTQVPPMYSAVKVGGIPLYKAARAGRTVERGAREVTVHEIHVLTISGRDVGLRIVCSKGTYIRTLCADIGESLGVGGHLLGLERSRVGPLTIRQALTLEQVQSHYALGDLAESLMSLDLALEALPAVMIEDEMTSVRVLNGVPVPVNEVRWEDGPEAEKYRAGQTVRLKSQGGRLLALATIPSAGVRRTIPGELSQTALPIVKVLVDR